MRPCSVSTAYMPSRNALFVLAAAEQHVCYRRGSVVVTTVFLMITLFCMHKHDAASVYEQCLVPQRNNLMVLCFISISYLNSNKNTYK